MVSHVHPSGTKMEKFTQFFEGSKALRRVIDKLQPDIMLCSHVHEAEGLEEKIGKTRVINVGAKGKIFEV
jgi:Icc-related predicted phosphoesterase